MTRDWTRTTLGDRVQYLAEREGVSLNKLGARAGLGSGAVSRLSRDHGPLNRSPETLDKLARACGVSVEWLTYGRGDPGLRGVPEPPEPFPHRSQACEIARDGGLDEEAVREVEALPKQEVRAILGPRWAHVADPPVLWWLRQIESRVVLHRVHA
ncbi:hypothetical protein BE21_08235 [Sorangium cellulosum]|uniref:HTH cro/C1-type domain-containing protein n=1 Tax=Sorangium cellulosum TaxID=56 RepID=A0A150U345_SORCE|nr:hypothetical protein BE21_08235 [Sorangium cellulosum]